MLYFDSDYMEGAHPKILERLMDTNMEKTPGYGTDSYCSRAGDMIRRACGCPEARVYFMVGGTQTNAAVIDGLLKSWQGVVCAKSGHINTHEAGAIEHSGHKVISLKEKDGKLDPDCLETYLEKFFQHENREHMTEPGAVYISHPTEYGTLYTAGELRRLHEICGQYHLPLYLDGARLGYGLAAETDVTLPLIGECCDVFYIGGTKVGALFGEAVVVTNEDLLKRFFTIMKQHGGLLAKGRILGIQFEQLFTDDLYVNIAKNAVKLAQKIQDALKNVGYPLKIQSPTNQIFVTLPDEKKKALEREVSFSFWEKEDESHTTVRFATSWATREEDVDQLIRLLETDD
ncbi:MAG TPA: low specificity L-threonine aldolase [Candidatus Eubacterium avistercoris]|uniref:Low specificity L-threonine aldolase n=1 Tax=Candidatus Eubacterium avistercoris TaxID=2838567 RepID=A0A9D2IFE3_9FIRM|nr:low specificity L-threonine aldolase [Candidatus Eubacterium avistercoris]